MGLRNNSNQPRFYPVSSLTTSLMAGLVSYIGFLTESSTPSRLLVGYFLAYLSFLPSIHMFRQRRRKYGSDSVSPEARLWWLLYGKLALFVLSCAINMRNKNSHSYDSDSMSTYRSVWICMDKSWSTKGSLDCPYAFHDGNWHWQCESLSPYSVAF